MLVDIFCKSAEVGTYFVIKNVSKELKIKIFVESGTVSDGMDHRIEKRINRWLASAEMEGSSIEHTGFWVHSPSGLAGIQYILTIIYRAR